MLLKCHRRISFIAFFPPVVQNLILICFMWHRLNFLSINRFERKKNIELAVSAFARLHNLEEHALQSQKLNEATLTIAGKSQSASFLGYITKEFHILMNLENGVCTWDAVFFFIPLCLLQKGPCTFLS